uniref:U2 small nuclear RNA auxiliary factor 1 like 4 n=1 Tax=Cebus imitator TaxID=2715852 RepID=A0A2K5QMU5_CEBIM
MKVCDNLGHHLVGNVYVTFRREEDAERAVLSPVTDFWESCCRQYEMGSPPRSHTGHRPRERNRRHSPDHRHGRF